jgi:protocatechuate 3,4-dioxygenase alpha subunit
MIPTASHTIGPFFPQGFFRPGDSDLRRLSPEAPPTARGDAMMLRGRVLELGGKPVVNAVLEAWQADASGRFRHPADPDWEAADPGFLGWGRAWTDAGGAYRFVTVRPGGYLDPIGARAPHIDLLVLGLGIMVPLATTAFLPGVQDDPVLRVLPEARRHLLVAAEDGTEEGMPAFRFDILLRGPAEEETPFFAD